VLGSTSEGVAGHVLRFRLRRLRVVLITGKNETSKAEDPSAPLLLYIKSDVRTRRRPRRGSTERRCRRHLARMRCPSLGARADDWDGPRSDCSTSPNCGLRGVGREFGSRYQRGTATTCWVRYLSERPSLVLPPLTRALLRLACTHALPSTCATLASGGMGGEHQHSVDVEGPSLVDFREMRDT
jgi:hypothetical protein